MTSLTTLLTDCLTACCSEPPMGERALMRERASRDRDMAKRRELRRAKRLPEENEYAVELEAYGGPLWDYPVRIPEGILPRVFDYAMTKQVTWQGVSGSLTDVRGTQEGVAFRVTASADGILGRHVTATTVGLIPYKPDDKSGKNIERDFCTGQWVDCPYGRVRVSRLMPDLQAMPYGADLRIGASFERPGWFRRVFSASLEKLEIHGTRARPVVDSRVKTFLLPDIRFVETPAALQVESK
jgi:hypothetical protein